MRRRRNATATATATPAARLVNYARTWLRAVSLRDEAEARKARNAADPILQQHPEHREKPPRPSLQAPVPRDLYIAWQCFVSASERAKLEKAVERLIAAITQGNRGKIAKLSDRMDAEWLKYSGDTFPFNAPIWYRGHLPVDWTMLAQLPITRRYARTDEEYLKRSNEVIDRLIELASGLKNTI